MLQQVCSCFASQVHVLTVNGFQRRFIIISRENLKCSFRHSKVVFELKRQISALNSPLHWLNHYAWNSSHNIISLISPSKSAFRSNTSNSDPTSSIFSAKLVLRVEWNETVCTRRDPFDTKKFWNLSPEILVEGIALLVNFFSVTSARYYIIIQQIVCTFRLIFLLPSMYFEIFPRCIVCFNMFWPSTCFCPKQNVKPKILDISS